MSTARKISTISPEAYLEFEESAKEKHEYYNGEVYAMAGGSPEHSLISINILGELRSALRGKPCKAYNSDLKVGIDSQNAFVYPDAFAVCGDLEFYGNRRDIVINPTLIVEVLSESTASFDRSLKFTKYRTLPSLKEYVLVEQKFSHIDCYFRSASGEWIFSSYMSLDDTIHLRSLGVHIPMRLIYEGLDLPPAPYLDEEK